MRIHRCICATSLLLVTLSAAASAARAQAPLEPRWASMASDSAAWQRVMTYVVQQFAPYILRTANDTVAQPWRLTLPEDEPQRALLESQLRSILRARAVLPEDSVFHELSLGPLVIASDTAWTTFKEGFTRRCPGSDRTTGYGSERLVYAVRHPSGWWGVARSDRALTGSNIGCARAKK